MESTEIAGILKEAEGILVKGGDGSLAEARVRVLEAYDAIVCRIAGQKTVAVDSEVDCHAHDSAAKHHRKAAQVSVDVNVGVTSAHVPDDERKDNAEEQSLFSTPIRSGGLFSLCEDDFEPLPKHRPDSSTIISEQPAEVPEPQSEDGRILGETVVEQTRTVADALRSSVDSPMSFSVPSLMDAISVADRFMIQKELFGGNKDRFDRTMAEIDRQLTLEDCIIYIEGNLSWPHNLSSTKVVMGALQRKFSR